MRTKYKHGTGQYRLNQAKDLAAIVLQNVNRIEYMWRLSTNDLINEEIAENEICGLIHDTDMVVESLKSHLKYREDLNQKGSEVK